MYHSPDTHTHTHTLAHIPGADDVLHKPFLTSCPSALEQPPGSCLRSRSSRHSVPKAADGALDERCEGLRTPLTPTDDKSRSRTGLDMKCTCCFQMTEGKNAETNDSQLTK